MDVLMSKHAGATQWFRALTPKPQSRSRLFCFPYAGGGAAIFQDWAQALPPDMEVCAAMLLGRSSRMREPPLTRRSTVVEHLVQAFTFYFDKPFAIFGHSVGALIGFDLARRLRREAGVEPNHMFVSGCHAPHLPDADPPPYNLPDDEFIEYLRRLNGTPRAMLEHQELMALMMPLLRADLEAVSTYTYVDSPPVSCPGSAYGGLRDSAVSREQLAAWREQTTANFILRMFNGNHFFIHQAVPLLTNTLSYELSQLVGEST